MDENKYRFFETIINLSKLVLIGFGVYLSLSAISESYNSKFWEERLQIYSEIIDVTSTLALENQNSNEFISAKKQFYKLYSGKLHMVSTVEVSRLILKFKLLLENKDLIAFNIQSGLLKDASFQLANELRKSLSEHYKINQK